MKQIYLKNGLSFNVSLKTLEKSKVITIYDYEKFEIATIEKSNIPTLDSITFVEAKMQPFYIVAIAEIYSNFDFYFDNLNQ